MSCGCSSYVLTWSCSFFEFGGHRCGRRVWGSWLRLSDHRHHSGHRGLGPNKIVSAIFHAGHHHGRRGRRSSMRMSAASPAVSLPARTISQRSWKVSMTIRTAVLAPASTRLAALRRGYSLAPSLRTKPLWTSSRTGPQHFPRKALRPRLDADRERRRDRSLVNR